MASNTFVWVFVGEHAAFPSGVFTTRERADSWIRNHRLSGVLTAYPVDQGAYDWAIDQGFFNPKNDDKRTPDFIGKFSSAMQEHFHYAEGVSDQ
jgi:hypothetical protein